MPWTTEQKTFIFEAYFRLNSIHAAQLQFKNGCREFPAHTMIYRWVNKFRTHGTVNNLNRKDTNRQSHSGRPKSSRTPQNADAVRDPEWSPHSPDLNAPDFYPWGYLKDRVYGNNPQTIPELNAAITAAIIAIPREECGRVIENLARRIQVRLQHRGAHLEHIF